MISQNIVNLVDTAMVGGVGTQALASVGIASFLHFFCTAFLMGLSVGVQTLTARWRGAGRADYAAPLNAGLLLVTLVGLPLWLGLSSGAGWLMSHTSDDLGVQRDGALYLQARLWGMVALGAHFAFRSYWSAVERASLYFASLLVMHLTNIALNWVLIYGHLGAPAMGVEGAGLGTALSMWVGAALHLAFALRAARPFGFLRALPSRDEWRELLRMSVPSGVERTLFALGMTVFMSLMGRLGAPALAASNVLLNLFLAALLPAMGFGIAASTFVARALGAGRPHEARGWHRSVAAWAVAALGALALLFGLAPEAIGRAFTDDPAALSVITPTLRLMALVLPLEAYHMVTYQSLLGLGDNRFVMLVSVAGQWLVTLPVTYLLTAHLGAAAWWVWGVHFAARAAQTLCYGLRWSARLQRLETRPR
jgi:putative MATE family efflux protein